MKNWKAQAKKLVSQANLIEAIGLMESNGIKTGNFLSEAQALEEESQAHVSNKTQFAPGEYAKYSARFSALTWAILQKINGTNNPMPKYLQDGN